MERHPHNKIMLAAMISLLTLIFIMTNTAYSQEPDAPLPLPLPYTLTFAADVAGKCKGEAPFAIEECACTVKNRLDRGWSQHKVLSAYYAPPRIPTTQETSTAYQTLNELEPCDDRFYFLYGAQDRIYLGITHIKPIHSVYGATGSVHLYEYHFAKRNK